MQDALTFGQCLAAWMKQRGLSVAELARRTDMKSATTVSRLVHDQSTPKRCEAFMQTILSSFPDLNEEEKALLQRGLSISYTGVADTIAEHALASMLLNKPAKPAANPLSELLLAHTDADQYDIYCVQCADQPIMEALDLLLRASDQRVRIHHFLVGPIPMGMASFIAAVQHFLCDPRYALTYYHAEHLSTTWMPGNMFLLRTQHNQVEQQLLILPKPGGRYAALPLDSTNDLYAFLLHASIDASHGVPPVTTTYMLNTPRNCLEYLSRTYDIEKGRPCCLLRAKPNLAMVPVDLLQTLYNDATDLQQTSVKDYSLALRRICFLRYANRWEESKSTRVIFSLKQMQEFMDTGLLMDHFSSLRPFQPQERRRILSHIIHMAKTNPNMHMYIARDEQLFELYRFSCYEGSGVILSPAKSSSCRPGAKKRYTEAFITDPVFTRQFRDLFINVLVPQYTFSRQESIALMEAMLTASENG